MKNPTSGFATQTAYNEALNELGERRDGPWVLAISAASVRSTSERRQKHEGRWHQHHRGQLMFVDDGVLLVRTEGESWVVPPGRAAWVPPGKTHAVSGTDVTNSWHLYLSPKASRVLPPKPCVVTLNALIEDLAPRAVSWSEQERLTATQRRLMTVLLDELRTAPLNRMQLPLPRDRRLLRIASAILDNPADERTRDEWAAWAGLSSRTLTRLFQQEVQITFHQWREKVVLTAALERLTHGESVAGVSDALGYATPSGFIAMFRRHFGESPARYLASQ
ncbi:helix-turn-helix domain-containing protein [Variovorax sp. OV329]|uniref:AraC family transcriptional regulator n=1 Tax=Variovorax sp. OV329 TaxID=1882825 RepID=UPI0008ECBFD5|nr:helix-turn-helix transcriptional regulator [Variovorax sp. OV329]SFM92617.1 transcriptional regulator, AraC family [Variovorax sp. OV329]